ncbi:hypothetical protein TRAPUB_13860 [Trametes pubescens]|uniref:Uncharacterized protein n=1 Tax=Trametes pubescens TaxID=154538 RepID=A0A1M2VQ11_TRAPU|nr:hypothetical protein TRAPUB_13860 [Trametes pubescens]
MNSNRPTGSLAACIRRSPSVRERLLSPDRDDQGGRQSRLGQSYTPVATGAESNLGSIARGGSLDSEVLVEVPSMHTARAVRALPSFRRGSTENDLELVEVPSARAPSSIRSGSADSDIEFVDAPSIRAVRILPRIRAGSSDSDIEFVDTPPARARVGAPAQVLGDDGQISVVSAARANRGTEVAIEGPRRSASEDAPPVLGPTARLRTPPAEPSFHPFAPSVVTSSRFMRDVIGLRVSMIAPLRSNGYGRPDLVIPERELRALLAKSLVWFVDRECVFRVDDSHVVFVGREHGEPGRVTYPSLAVRELRKLAEELPNAMVTTAASEDFDAYLFHARKYFRNGWLEVVAVIVGVFLSATIVATVVYCVLRLARALM